MPASSSAEIREAVHAFPRWHYEFDLAGVVTPIFDRGHINRHRQRKAYFFDPLVRLCGGTLAGKRVLDLGCNAGFWSLNAVEAGCDFVLALDGRQMHVDQAELVFRVNGIDPGRYRFACANVFDFDLAQEEPFDVVLCLGLMYHVANPVALLERASTVSSDLLVIDTTLSSREGSLLEVRREPLDDPRNAVEHELVTWPTRRAVVDMAEQFGWQIRTLAPRFSSWEGSRDFETGNRRAFVCAKETDLDTAELEIEDAAR